VAELRAEPTGDPAAPPTKPQRASQPTPAAALGRDISLRRMEQEGVALTTASVVAELTGDYPKHAQTMRG
jgi:hypothetical protein